MFDIGLVLGLGVRFRVSVRVRIFSEIGVWCKFQIRLELGLALGDRH